MVIKKIVDMGPFTIDPPLKEPWQFWDLEKKNLVMNYNKPSFKYFFQLEVGVLGNPTHGHGWKQKPLFLLYTSGDQF
jgi:hypothetical protein